ncbi:MAG TPA: polysaccharide ABC transporter ATP-binding protein [Acidimicrobiia bacterium]
MAGAIEVHDVSKRFRLSHERYSSLKERVVRLGRRVDREDFWALKDISLEIPHGRTYGLIGHNGSGKSTLLKCIAGILQPTSGEIRTEGRLAALLELGAGFHPDLTGRENVYLNGSILGLSKHEIDARFDEIVDFAELSQFIDMQVRNYSSGMFVRLGFSVAVSLDPDILLVDEVLAVGDEAFQKKCLARVRQMQHEGKTIVVVSHSIDLISRVCSMAAVLDHGVLELEGPTILAADKMRELMWGPGGPPPDDGEMPAPILVKSPNPTAEFRSRLVISWVSVEYPDASDGQAGDDAEDAKAADSGGTVAVHVRYDAKEPTPDTEFVITVFSPDETRVVYAVDTRVLGFEVPVLDGVGEVVLELPDLPLLEGEYPFSIGIRGPGESVFDWHEKVDTFKVVRTSVAEGEVDLGARVRHNPNAATI